MDTEFMKEIKARIQGNFGPSRFAAFMIRNLSKWEDINNLEIQELVDEFKYHSNTYALFPFFYDYLGIDLYKLYIHLSNELNWLPNRVEVQINSFESHHPYDVFADNIKKGVEKKLKEISERLLEQGAFSASYFDKIKGNA